MKNTYLKDLENKVHEEKISTRSEKEMVIVFVALIIMLVVAICLN